MTGGSAARRCYRAVLRLAAQHDADPALKLLLPSTLQRMVSGQHGSLRSAVKQAVRTGHQVPQPISLKQGQLVLQRNLHREAAWSMHNNRHLQGAPQPVNFHPNHDWFWGKLDRIAFCDVSVLDLWRSGRPQELDILRSMHQVACIPTAEIYMQAMDQLSRREGAYPLVVDALWLWEAHGKGADHISLRKADVADCLIRSSLLDTKRLPMEASWRHPLGVWRAMLSGGIGAPENTLSNQVLSRVATAATRHTARADKREMLACLKRAVKDGISHGVRLSLATRGDLLKGFLATGDMKAAFNTAASLASHGGSVPAQSLLELIEWAAEVGDRKKLAFLEDELFASGKGQYLAALNSPSC
eukprot:jgi/Tetstr1/423391/TSEL_014077.t1